ncbi:MAG: flavodoxin family protein [Smithellaceae bacterium]|nr:flavodoxin family protein [Smithellaceae bacterium]
MKILGINASPKGSKSQTLRLVEAVLDGASSKGAQVELVDLCRMKIEYCNACGVCHKTGTCAKKDGFQVLYRKILAADGLVMGSPNYFRSVTAQMKTMIDRMADAVHCQLLIGKYTVNVATAGGIGQHKQVLDYLDEIMLNFGSFITGSTGVAMRQGTKALMAAEVRAMKLGGRLVDDITKKKNYPKQKKMIEENSKYFQDLIMMYKDEWPHEYEHWTRIGAAKG